MKFSQSIIQVAATIGPMANAALTPGPEFIRLNKNDSVRFLPLIPTLRFSPPLTTFADGNRSRFASRPLQRRKCTD